MSGPFARDRVDDQIAAWDRYETDADDDRLHGHDTDDDPGTQEKEA